MARRREAVSGLGMLEALSARLRRQALAAAARAQAAAERGGVATGLTRSVRLAVQSGVMALSAWLVLRHELTPGAIMAASILASKALAPVEQMVATWRTVGTARESWGQLRALLARPAPAPRSALPVPAGRVAVEAATVRGAEGHVLLREVSLGLEPGECLVVVGPSGAGKSTLCRLLAGTARPAGAPSASTAPGSTTTRGASSAGRPATCRRTWGCSPARSPRTSPAWARIPTRGSWPRRPGSPARTR